MRELWKVGVLTAAACWIPFQVGTASGEAPAAGHREAIRRLERIARTADPRVNPALNGARAQMIAAVSEPTDLAKLAPYLLMLGQELMLDSQSEAAVENLERVRQLIEQGKSPFADKGRRTAEELLALAYLRLGEQENCIGDHNADRCLLPIRGGGVHSLKRGSLAAIEVYKRLLKKYPDDLGYRWLMNLAYMTLGRHPQDVPSRLLVPSSAFESEIPFPRFPEVAPAVGVNAFGLAGGSVMDDFSGDGLLDIVASSWGLSDQLRYYVNLGNGTFRDATREAELTGITGGLNIRSADYDNDGHLDLLVLRGAWLREAGLHPNSLLRNNGDGTFTDVTAAVGLLTLHPTQVGAWGDYDNDGWLDLYLGNESEEGSRHPSELFHNNGDGTFTDVAAELGVAAETFIKGAAWGDYDGDGLSDLYVSSLNAPNLLYHNEGMGSDGKWSFREVARQAGVAEPVVSFPVWFWDYDNDGWEDLWVSGYRGEISDVAADYLGLPLREWVAPRLYRNNGNGTFADVTRAVGLERALVTMGSNFGDLDNDGYLDFYVGTGNTPMDTLMPNLMFRNAGGRRFQDVTTAGGFGHLQKGHGVAFGDLDNDGDQDIYAVSGGWHSGDGFWNLLFENPGFGNRWVTLELVGIQSNRSALGARVKIYVETPQGPRHIHRTVRNGSSFGVNSLRLEVGLGRASAITAVEVLWPGGSKPQLVHGLEMNRAYRLRQGTAAEPLDLPTFRLASPGHPHPSHTRHPRGTDTGSSGGES